MDYNDVYIKFKKAETLKQLENIPKNNYPEIHFWGYYHQGDYLRYVVGIKNREISLNLSTAKLLRKDGLLEIIPDWENYWVALFAKEKDSDAKIITRAGEFIIKECLKAGKLDPKKIRPLGVWRDFGEYIYNDGSGEINSPQREYKYIPHGPVRKRPTNDYLSEEELLDLYNDFAGLITPSAGVEGLVFCMSWLVQAQIFTVMPWRFAIWIFGEAGSGKSTIGNAILSMCPNKISVMAPTIAAIQQLTGSEGAIPIYFDEADSHNIRGLKKENVSEIVDFLKGVSLGDDGNSSAVIRGSGSGKLNHYSPNLVVMFSGITTPDFDEAEEGRIFSIKCSTANNTKDFMNIINPKILKWREKKWEFFNTVLNNTEKILKTRSELKQKLSSIVSNSRFVDSYSTVLACLSIFHPRFNVKTDTEGFLNMMNFKESEQYDIATNKNPLTGNSDKIMSAGSLESEIIEEFLSLPVDKKYYTTDTIIELIIETIIHKTSWRKFHQEKALERCGIRIKEREKNFVLFFLRAKGGIWHYDMKRRYGPWIKRLKNSDFCMNQRTFEYFSRMRVGGILLKIDLKKDAPID